MDPWIFMMNLWILLKISGSESEFPWTGQKTVQPLRFFSWNLELVKTETELNWNMRSSLRPYFQITLKVEQFKNSANCWIPTCFLGGHSYALELRYKQHLTSDCDDSWTHKSSSHLPRDVRPLAGRSNIPFLASSPIMRQHQGGYYPRIRVRVVSNYLSFASPLKFPGWGWGGPFYSVLHVLSTKWLFPAYKMVWTQTQPYKMVLLCQVYWTFFFQQKKWYFHPKMVKQLHSYSEKNSRAIL